MSRTNDDIKPQNSFLYTWKQRGGVFWKAWKEFFKSSSFSDLKMCLHVHERPKCIEKAMFVKMHADKAWKKIINFFHLVWLPAWLQQSVSEKLSEATCEWWGTGRSYQLLQDFNNSKLRLNLFSSRTLHRCFSSAGDLTYVFRRNSSAWLFTHINVVFIKLSRRGRGRAQSSLPLCGSLKGKLKIAEYKFIMRP